MTLNSYQLINVFKSYKEEGDGEGEKKKDNIINYHGSGVY